MRALDVPNVTNFLKSAYQNISDQPIAPSLLTSHSKWTQSTRKKIVFFIAKAKAIRALQSKNFKTG